MSWSSTEQTAFGGTLIGLKLQVMGRSACGSADPISANEHSPIQIQIVAISPNGAKLAAYGTIGQCYMALSDPANARTHALLGLERARKLNEHRRAAAFLADLARIEELDGDIPKSIR
jgi:hypothetical protein